MHKFTIELSDAELKALAHVAYDPEEWIHNAIHFRCSTAIDDIVNAEVQRLLSEGKPITGSKEDIVMAAKIESAADREERNLELQQAFESQKG